MFKEIKIKIYNTLGVSENADIRDRWTFYRVLNLLTSKRGLKKVWLLFIRTIKYILKKTLGIKFPTPGYKNWVKKNFPNKNQLNEFKTNEKNLAYRPLVSIILPVFNPPEKFFIEALNSILAQIYTNWELCIADDASTNETIREIIKSYAEKDSRIKYIFRDTNEHISIASNSAIEISSGEYIALLDHDDKLSPDALYQNILILNLNNDIDFIYSDEDYIDENGKHFNPSFKTDWCPDNLLSRNYLCHFSVIKSSLIRELGGFRIGFEGSQDHDLFLRITEKTNKIYHIPKILYHWRVHKQSTSYNDKAKPYAHENGKKAIEEALVRRNENGKVLIVDEPNCPKFYSVRYEIESYKKVSVIIPTKNLTTVTNTCLSSIFNLTDYPNYEVILINNNSDETSFFEMVKKWEEKEPNRFKCIEDSGSFNFSRLMNGAAKISEGEFLLLLNNDTEVINKDWMTSMVQQSQRKSIGAVGVKLLFPNRTIQHAGVIIGLGGIAGHTFIGFEEHANVYRDYLKITRNYSAVTAACLMVRKSVYNEVNGFDENFAVDFNDIDFCLKIKELGYNNIYLPHVTLIHYESISRGHPHKTKESYERHLKEISLFKKRWQKYIDHDPCYNPHLSLTHTDFRINLD